MMQTVIEVLGTLADVLFLLWFIPKMQKCSLRERLWSILWAALLLAYQLIADQLLQGFDLLYSGGMLVFALGFSFFCSKRKSLWFVFSALAFMIIMILSNSAVYAVFSVVIDGFVDYMPGFSLLLRSLYILVCKIVQFAFYRLVLWIFRRDQQIDPLTGILSFVMTIATAFGLGSLMKISIANQSLSVDALVVILVGVLLLVNVILYVMVYQVQTLTKSKYALSLMQERVRSDKFRVEEAQAIWEKIRHVKHDLKNHFSVMRGYLDNGETDSCKAYLGELNHMVDAMGDIIQSGNSVIDYLINTKLAGLHDVKILVTGYAGCFSDIHDVDLASILGNILDNATEAQESVKGEKRIELFFCQKDAIRMIVCKNTVSTSVLSENKHLRTTKTDTDAHGLGHKIVESTAEKYGGMVDYFEEEGMFGVAVVLPFEK